MWNEGVEVPAPDIVRARSGQNSAVQNVPGNTPNQNSETTSNAAPPADEAQQDAVSQPSQGAVETASQENPLPEEHPLLAANKPRRRATAPASFGTNATSKPREQKSTSSDSTDKSVDQVFLGIGEEAMIITDKPEVTRSSSGVQAPAGSTSSAIRPNAALLMECPACDARISKRATRCPKCNTAPYQPCQVCATTIMVNSESCGECGDPDPFNAEAFGSPRA
jgi:hypothetical protein